MPLCLFQSRTVSVEKTMKCTVLLTGCFLNCFLGGCASSLPWMDSQQAAIEKENTEVAVPRVPVVDETVTIVAGEFEQVGTSYSVEPGQKIKIAMTGDGDADLYVRFRYRPTKNRFDCRPFRADSNEECEMVVPPGQTKLYIKVDGGAAGEQSTQHLWSRDATRAQ